MDGRRFHTSGDEEAHLNLTGSIVRLALEEEPHSLNYLTPSKNQCKSCHATNHTNGEILPIGPKARHPNKSSPLYAVNQIDYLTDKGILSQVASTIDKNAVYTDMGADLSHRARSYLDINCGHCHNEMERLTLPASSSIIKIISLLNWDYASRQSQRAGALVAACTPLPQADRKNRLCPID